MFDVSYSIVIKYTKDLKFIPKRPDITYRAFELLKELQMNGYVFANEKFTLDDYRRLKINMPNIIKVNAYNKTIFFEKSKSKIAAKAFLKELNKRYFTYQEIQKVVNQFKIKMDINEKRPFMHKPKRSKSQYKASNCKKTQERSYQEKNDSCIFFDIRNYRKKN